MLNDTVGFSLHTVSLFIDYGAVELAIITQLYQVLLIPYFAWQRTHGNHHVRILHLLLLLLYFKPFYKEIDGPHGSRRGIFILVL